MPYSASGILLVTWDAMVHKNTHGHFPLGVYSLLRERCTIIKYHKNKCKIAILINTEREVCGDMRYKRISGMSSSSNGGLIVADRTHLISS